MRWLCIFLVMLSATKSLAQELPFTSLPSKSRNLLFLIQGGQVESYEIFVQGWYCLTNGEGGLFLTRSDCLAGNVDNAIRLEHSARRIRELDAWGQPRFIEVSGDFTSWRQHQPAQSTFIWGELKANGRHITDITPVAFRTVAEQEAEAKRLQKNEERGEIFWKLLVLIYDEEDQCISSVKELCGLDGFFEQSMKILKEICPARPDDLSIKPLCELLQEYQAFLERWP
ncbi:hypothetical protein ABC502_09070 [Alkalimonas sp. NCh-2]|uniref:hypothetical protein n=1 Tax=Alkalimonas sp. NCh-2 TaxID=3144846 RepID=UPI0031F640F5